MMAAVSREFRVSCPWELLYVDDPAILRDSFVDLKNRLAARKTSLESCGLHVNVNKTKILVSSAKHTKISARNPKYPCGVCTFGVGGNSILCTSCDLWVHNKCSGITDHLTDNRNSECHKCSSEIVPAAIAAFKEVNFENDSFHVESTFKYLGDTIGQCGGCSDAVSTQSFRQLLPILTNRAIQTKLRGIVFNMCVRKVFFYSSETWPVVTDVQRLVTGDSAMIRWICGVSLKDRIPTTDLLLRLGLSSINGMLCFN